MGSSSTAIIYTIYLSWCVSHKVDSNATVWSNGRKSLRRLFLQRPPTRRQRPPPRKNYTVLKEAASGRKQQPTRNTTLLKWRSPRTTTLGSASQHLLAPSAALCDRSVAAAVVLQLDKQAAGDDDAEDLDNWDADADGADNHQVVLDHVAHLVHTALPTCGNR